MDYDQVLNIFPPFSCICHENPQVLQQIGEFGAWQRGVSLWCWLAYVMTGVHSLMNSFTGDLYTHDHPLAENGGASRDRGDYFTELSLGRLESYKDWAQLKN